MKIFYKHECQNLKKEFKEMVEIKNKSILEREEKIKDLTNYSFDLLDKKSKAERKKDIEEQNGIKLQIMLDELQEKYEKSYKESRNKTRKIHQLEKQIEEYKTEGRYIIKKLPDDKTKRKQLMKVKNTSASSNIARKMKGGK